MNKKRNLEIILTKTEEKWLKILYHKIKSEFTRHPLPSHDHTHHYRVWQYTKELLRTLSGAGYDIDSTMIEKAIISVFFHDAGMTVTPDTMHGVESRLICEKYLHQNTGLSRSLVDEILEAIEMHDDKKYAQKMQGINTYSILGVADDLDAYGAIGIYRYYEIYLLRGIRKEEIPKNVILNIEQRFSFMEKTFSILDALIKKHQTRKRFTKNYYNQFLQTDSTVDHELMSLHMEFLDLLVKRAHQFKNGLDFLMDDKIKLSGVNKEVRPLILTLKKELRKFQLGY